MLVHLSVEMVTDRYDSKILTACLDNATNNDTLCQALAELIPGFLGMAARTRCFPHIVNLIAKVSSNSNISGYTICLTTS